MGNSECQLINDGRESSNSADHRLSSREYREKLTEDASVIIVTFNSSSYIGRAVESVLLNDPLEVIVVDNSSTDGTPELIAREFPEVRIARKVANTLYHINFKILKLLNEK